MGAAPKAAVVFDVNVLIDAADPQSRNHASAVRALSDDNGMPIYFSELMLKTTANKLLELGADPSVVREYMELIMSEDDYGPEKHTLGHIPLTDYGLVDKYGKSDYEDSTIISLMDAAENDAQLPAVLVSSDSELREWCNLNHRVAVRPDQLPRLSTHMADDIQQATSQYLSRRMFRDGAPRVRREDTKPHAKQIITSVRDELKKNRPAANTRTEALYRRFPELRHDEGADRAPDDSLQL